MEGLEFSRFQGKLYDRSKQERKLLDAYRRVVSSAAASSLNTDQRDRELILISGASGTGKTALAQILREPVSKDGGFFVSGKFDQIQRPEPYAPLVAAFTELVNLMLSTDDGGSMRESISKSVGGEANILADMIPALIQLTRERKENAADMQHSSEYLKHFRAVFRRFARAVCSMEHPVVLFLDDLQWADPSSLDLITSLTTDPDSRGMVVVISCRDNVSPDCYLSTKLREMESAKVKITNVGVKNLQEEGVNKLLCDLLKLGEEDLELCRPLATTVFRKTHGNVPYVMEVLQYLTAENLMTFDCDREKWDWDMEKVEKTLSSEEEGSTILDLIHERMSRLTPHVQDILKIASCIGAKSDELVIERASSSSENEISEALQVAADAGLIQYDPKLGTCVFAHDNIQQAAYYLIPKGERQIFHLNIGRVLWKRFSADELEKHVFVVLNQLDSGGQLVTDQRERYGVASLCLLAGRKAIKSSGFRVASEYLSRAISLLGGDSWRDEYGLTLSLYNSAAEVEFVTANFQRMDELIASVLLRARCLRDKLPAYATQVYSLGARDQKDLAIDTGLDVLDKLGESFPRDNHRVYITMEARKIQQLLRGRTDEGLKRLPLLNDPDKIAAMKILSLLFRNTYVSRPQLVPLIVMRMVQITLRHGVSVVSSVAFAEYGMMLCGIRGDTKGGYRYGRLALGLLDRFNATEWLPRVYAAFYGGINHWNAAISLSLKPLKYAHQVGLESGDIETSMLCINLYQYHSLHCGKPIPALEKEVRSNHKLMTAYKQHSSLGMLCPFWQMLLNMMGRCEDPLVLKGEAYDEEQGLKMAAEKNLKILFMSIHYIKMVLAFSLGEYALAEKMAAGCQNAEKHAIAAHTVALVTFFHGMTVLALARESKGRKKRLSVARNCIKKTRRRAFYSPQTYLDQQFLLEAEYASILGQKEVALAKYTCAISLAGEHGARLIYALANERAAIHHSMCINSEHLVRAYYEKAYLEYVDIGSFAKAKYLKSKVTSLQELD